MTLEAYQGYAARMMTTTNELPPVLAAVTAADPYAYYAELRASRPFGHDPELGAWVAADAASVHAALAEPRLAVRPKAERVPRAIVGSAAGDIFRDLVRMDDSQSHGRRKEAISATIGETLVPAIIGESRRHAQRLAQEGAGIDAMAFRLPIFTVASLLGIPEADLEGIAERVGLFVRCLAPGGREAEIAAGKKAAEELRELFAELTGPAALAARLPGEPAAAAIANVIGFLTQAYEATAGLIANTALVLMRRPALRRKVIIADPRKIEAIVRETARFDPPVQNTRRFAGEDFVFRGRQVKEGETVLVVLAAACRDPALYPDPDTFEPARPAVPNPVWGHGRHACPGSALATEIAATAIAALLQRGAVPEEAPPFTYRRSLNTRIPIFGQEAARSQR